MSIELILVSIAYIPLFYMMVRNNWVCSELLRLIRDDLEKFNMMPSYDYIFYKFWVWDINKFILLKQNT